MSVPVVVAPAGPKPVAASGPLAAVGDCDDTLVVTRPPALDECVGDLTGTWLMESYEFPSLTLSFSSGVTGRSGECEAQVIAVGEHVQLRFRFDSAGDGQLLATEADFVTRHRESCSREIVSLPREESTVSFDCRSDCGLCECHRVWESQVGAIEWDPEQAALSLELWAEQTHWTTCVQGDRLEMLSDLGRSLVMRRVEACQLGACTGVSEQCGTAILQQSCLDLDGCSWDPDECGARPCALHDVGSSRCRFVDEP